MSIQIEEFAKEQTACHRISEDGNILGQHFSDGIVVPVQDGLGVREGEERGLAVIGTHS